MQFSRKEFQVVVNVIGGVHWYTLCVRRWYLFIPGRWKTVRPTMHTSYASAYALSGYPPLHRTES